MQIPYRHGLLSSDIDYEKLIQMQSEACNQTMNKNKNEMNGKSMVKSKTYETKRIHRGGKR